jgi:hypothetical protein
MKSIVFDIDETLGSFTQLYILWKIINKYFKKYNIYTNFINTQILFNLLLDNFPLYLRPNILNVFEYILHEKNKNNINKVLIFTNNQVSKEWINYIVKYIEYKLHDKIFDKIIYAHKIKNHIVENNRTSNEKIYQDLIKIGNLQNYKICFIDDLFHKKMFHSNVNYIHIPPYTYFYSLKTIVDTLNKRIKLPKSHFFLFITTEFDKYLFGIPNSTLSFDLLHKIKYFTNT